MPKGLTAERIASYRANGFLYPNDALSAAEVAHYREALRKTEARLGGSLMDIDRKYRGNLHFLCRWVDELTRHPAILDVVEDLIGPDILLYTSRFFIQEPRPQQDFGAAETQRHDQTFKAYLESFYEQLVLAEKDIPADLAALAP